MISKMKKTYEGYIWKNRFREAGQRSFIGNTILTPGLVADKNIMSGGHKKDILKVRITIEEI